MINIIMHFPRLHEIFTKHEEDIMMVMAAAMQTNRAMMFDADGADNGKEKWAPLKFRKGRPLQHRGTLRKSFAPSNDGIRPGKGPDSVLRVSTDQVQIGTKLLYARMMNDGTTKMPGGVLRPTKAKALKIPAPPGSKQKFLFRKSVKIPARPMDIMSEEDRIEIADTVANYIASILNNG